MGLQFPLKPTQFSAKQRHTHREKEKKHNHMASARCCMYIFSLLSGASIFSLAMGSRETVHTVEKLQGDQKKYNFGKKQELWDVILTEENLGGKTSIFRLDSQKVQDSDLAEKSAQPHPTSALVKSRMHRLLRESKYRIYEISQLIFSCFNCPYIATFLLSFLLAFLSDVKDQILAQLSGHKLA